MVTLIIKTLHLLFFRSGVESLCCMSIEIPNLQLEELHPGLKSTLIFLKAARESQQSSSPSSAARAFCRSTNGAVSSPPPAPPARHSTLAASRSRLTSSAWVSATPVGNLLAISARHTHEGQPTHCATTNATSTTASMTTGGGAYMDWPRASAAAAAGPTTHASHAAPASAAFVTLLAR